MSLLPVTTPEFNRPVRAIIKHCDKWLTSTVNLVAVDESDCLWRFREDNCELSYDWNVVYWEYQD